MKYVIATVNNGTAVALFSDAVTHREVYGAMHHSARERSSNWSCQRKSAGFFTIDNDIVDGQSRPRVRTYGYSDSMELGPQGDDAGLIAAHLGLPAPT